MRNQILQGDIQKVLDVGKAKEVAGYIKRRNRRHPEMLATLGRVCQRFRLTQREMKRIIENNDCLSLSKLAYVYPEPGVGNDWSKLLIGAFWPQFVEPVQVPDSQRLVIVLS